MDLNLAGKSVVITGGSRGIGYACAEAIAIRASHSSARDR